MNVANALAAAAAAWAYGAHLHDIRQGLRTFSTRSSRPGPVESDRPRWWRPWRHRLLPQRRRDAPAGRLRGPDDDRLGRRHDERQTGRSRSAPRSRHDPGAGATARVGGLSASSASRAIGATRISASTGRWRRRLSMRSWSGRIATFGPRGRRIGCQRPGRRGTSAGERAGTDGAGRCGAGRDGGRP